MTLHFIDPEFLVQHGSTPMPMNFYAREKLLLTTLEYSWPMLLQPFLIVNRTLLQAVAATAPFVLRLRGTIIIELRFL